MSDLEFISVRDSFSQMEICEQISHNICQIISKLNKINQQIEAQKKYIQESVNLTVKNSCDDTSLDEKIIHNRLTKFKHNSTIIFKNKHKSIEEIEFKSNFFPKFVSQIEESESVENITVLNFLKGINILIDHKNDNSSLSTSFNKINKKVQHFNEDTLWNILCLSKNSKDDFLNLFSDDLQSTNVLKQNHIINISVVDCRFIFENYDPFKTLGLKVGVYKFKLLETETLFFNNIDTDVININSSKTTEYSPHQPNGDEHNTLFGYSDMITIQIYKEFKNPIIFYHLSNDGTKNEHFLFFYKSIDEKIFQFCRGFNIQNFYQY